MVERQGQQADPGLIPGGYLILAGQTGLAALQDNHRVQTAEGAPIRLVHSNAPAQAFCWLDCDGLAAGAYGEAYEAWFEADALLRYFWRDLPAAGVPLNEAEITAIDIAPGRVTGVRLADGRQIGYGAPSLSSIAPTRRTACRWSPTSLASGCGRRGDIISPAIRRRQNTIRPPICTTWKPTTVFLKKRSDRLWRPTFRHLRPSKSSMHGLATTISIHPTRTPSSDRIRNCRISSMPTAFPATAWNMRPASAAPSPNG
ncbi:MAG TPA: hypothetical protein VLA28_04590 [Afifellaceae bacterium]|nr:hypothetical protein [Afifellaceae bacterium]